MRVWICVCVCEVSQLRAELATFRISSEAVGFAHAWVSSPTANAPNYH